MLLFEIIGGALLALSLLALVGSEPMRMQR
jgi:hypothetical protein